MSSQRTPLYNIVNGPSKWDFVVNFFTSVSKRNGLQFTLKPNIINACRTHLNEHQVHLNILWIGLEDGSAELFLIKGDGFQGHPFEGFYNSKNRTGYLSYSD